MAEAVGFEPTIQFLVCQFSRLVHSTTLPRFRELIINTNYLVVPEIYKPHGFQQIQIPRIQS